MSNILAFSLILLVFQYIYSHEITFDVRQYLFHMVHPVWTTQFLSVFGPLLVFLYPDERAAWLPLQVLLYKLQQLHLHWFSPVYPATIFFIRLWKCTDETQIHTVSAAALYQILCVGFLFLLLKVTELSLRSYCLSFYSRPSLRSFPSFSDCGYSCSFCNTHHRCYVLLTNTVHFLSINYFTAQSHNLSVNYQPQCCVYLHISVTVIYGCLTLLDPYHFGQINPCWGNKAEPPPPFPKEQ